MPLSEISISTDAVKKASARKTQWNEVKRRKMNSNGNGVHRLGEAFAHLAHTYLISTRKTAWRHKIADTHSKTKAQLGAKLCRQTAQGKVLSNDSVSVRREG